MRISVSTLCFWDFGKDVNKIVDYISNYIVDGVELNIRAEFLKDFKLTQGSSEYLKRLRWNSLHAPDINNDNIEGYSEKLKSLYQEINAMWISFHPLQFKGEYNLRDYFKGCNINVENVNMEDKKTKDANEMIPELKEILSKDNDVGICLDSAHVKSLDELRLYIREFNDKIRCVHASDNLGKHKFDHILFYKSGNDERLKEIIRLDKPLIIEGKMERWGDMEKEFEFIRGYAK